MRQKMVVEDAVCFEALAAIRALVGSGAAVSAHVQGEAVADAERLAADATDVGFFTGVDALVLDLLMRTSETAAAVLTFVPEIVK